MKQIKRLLLLVIVSLVGITLSGCNNENTLLLLNWGEYINDDLLVKFEEEYNCTVKMSIADSNEAFYAKVKGKTTAYDLVVPSDYMIEKMYENNLLEELDFSKIPNYDYEKFLPGVKGIMSNMFANNEKYHVPYFWGTFGIMYNKNLVGTNNDISLEETLLKEGWNAYFNADKVYGSKIRVGMYDTPRYAYAAAMFYNHLSPNELNEDKYKLFEETLKLQNFSLWGTDTLKKGIVADNLDLAFVYTGDFLDMLYTKIDDGVKMEDINFEIYIPDETIAFLDSLVMPKNARHKDLAYKFINFMLRPENAYMNASVVGYCTPLIESYNMIINPIDPTDDWLNDWSVAITKYYPLPNPSDEKQYKGTPLSNISKDESTILTNIVNKIKSK